MPVGLTGGEDPIIAIRATLQIESAEVVDSKFRDQKDREQKQFATELKVLEGAGDRDGESFSEWFTFPATGEISAKSKAGQVVEATLGESASAETLEELASQMVGKTFAAQIGTSKDGQYSRVTHDTIAPAKGSGGSSSSQGSNSDDGGSNDGTEEEVDFNQIPF